VALNTILKTLSVWLLGYVAEMDFTIDISPGELFTDVFQEI
jgi:hypothetical protein